MPDPAVLAAGGVFHLYTTQGSGSNVQTATSKDLVNWTEGPDALPSVGSWARLGNTWAPEVLARNGRFVMFYTATDIASGRQCVGRAESTSPAGPFVDHGKKAFVCQPELGGDIDANPVVISGKPYLYWKNDGNCCGKPVHLWGQALNADATELIGRPVQLLSNTQSWQGNLVEAPEMVAHAGKFYLFYSANDYASTSYTEGYAICAKPLGPCLDQSKPVLVSTDKAAGPGHAYIFTVGQNWWILYHAWPPDAIGSELPGRQLWLDPLTWDRSSKPVVTGPNAATQPLPKLG
jgi:beta-xylosidase